MMEYVWSSDIDAILSVGRKLDCVGVRNWALDKEAALAALGQLSAIKIAVLGGDVYALSGTNVESNYDNWYCSRNSGEADADFVDRSIAEARKYILNYQEDASGVLFAMVPMIVSK